MGVRKGGGGEKKSDLRWDPPRNPPSGRVLRSARLHGPRSPQDRRAQPTSRACFSYPCQEQRLKEPLEQAAVHGTQPRGAHVAPPAPVTPPQTRPGRDLPPPCRLPRDPRLPPPPRASPWVPGLGPHGGSRLQKIVDCVKHCAGPPTTVAGRRVRARAHTCTCAHSCAVHARLGRPKKYGIEGDGGLIERERMEIG